MILKHRDRDLLRFAWIEPQGVRVLSVNEAERKFLPLEMKGVATDEMLWQWLTLRTVPRNRRNIEELMARIGLNSRNIRGIISRIDAINDFLQKRINHIFEYGEKADELFETRNESCTVNHANHKIECTVSSDSLAYQIKQNMRADPFITTVELSEILNVSKRWIAHKMKALQESCEIKRMGADKNGYWLVVSD